LAKSAASATTNPRAGKTRNVLIFNLLEETTRRGRASGYDLNQHLPGTGKWPSNLQLTKGVRKIPSMRFMTQSSSIGFAQTLRVEDKVIIRADCGAEQKATVGAVVPALGAVGIHGIEPATLDKLDDAIRTDVRFLEQAGTVVRLKSPESTAARFKCFQPETLRQVKSDRVDCSVGANGGLRVAKPSCRNLWN
jgi:hypothetical protein